MNVKFEWSDCQNESGEDKPSALVAASRWPSGARLARLSLVDGRHLRSVCCFSFNACIVQRLAGQMMGRFRPSM